MPVGQRLDRQDKAARAGLDGYILAACQVTVDQQVQRRRSRQIGFNLGAEAEPFALTQLRRRVECPHQDLGSADRFERHDH